MKEHFEIIFSFALYFIHMSDNKTENLPPSGRHCRIELSDSWPCFMSLLCDSYHQYSGWAHCTVYEYTHEHDACMLPYLRSRSIVAHQNPEWIRSDSEWAICFIHSNSCDFHTHHLYRSPRLATFANGVFDEQSKKGNFYIDIPFLRMREHRNSNFPKLLKFLLNY